MNTTNLRDYLYGRAAQLFDPPLTRGDVASIIDLFVDGITAGLVGEAELDDDDGDLKVLLRGFGTFRVVKRQGRTYSVRGKEVEVGDRYTVVFKPGAELMRALDSVELGSND